MRHKFPTIEDKGGLKIHLDTSKQSHRGFGYKTYRILRIAGLNVSNRAKAFNVVWDTMKEWDKVDDKEQKARKTQSEKAVEELRVD